jgi:RNA recognition motif-containing protein
MSTKKSGEIANVFEITNVFTQIAWCQGVPANPRQLPLHCCARALCSQDAFIPQDRESGRSRGFAFVTMADSAAAQAAISQLHDSDYNVSCTASMWDQCMLCAP